MIAPVAQNSLFLVSSTLGANGAEQKLRAHQILKTCFAQGLTTFSISASNVKEILRHTVFSDGGKF